MENLEEQAKQMSIGQLETRIQYCCEQMHESYMHGDEIRRTELGRQRDVYTREYEKQSNKKPEQH